MKNIVYTPFSSHRFKLEKAEGSFLYTHEDQELIDFTSGWNVTNLGWNNEEIIQAVKKQLKENTYVPMWASDNTQESYAEELLKSIGDEYDRVARATSGMEAVEMAIKTARVYTGKKKILSFVEQYHGGSINALSMSYRNEWLGKLTNDLDNFEKLDYPDIYRTDKTEDELLSELKEKIEEKLSTGEFACVITEAGIVTGRGSVMVAPEGFIEMVYKLCKKYEVLLILDEVGTGFSRTGELFAFHGHDVKPDIITLAKAIANGTATIAAMVSTQNIIENSYKDTNLQSTFGWNPVACAAAAKTLEIHKRDKVWKESKLKGDFMKKYLNDSLKQKEFVGDIRGMGMEIGVDIVKDKKTKEKDTDLLESIIEEAFENGLHLVSDHESNIQIMPPLTIEQRVLEKGLAILVETIKESSEAL